MCHLCSYGRSDPYFQNVDFHTHIEFEDKEANS